MSAQSVQAKKRPSKAWRVVRIVASTVLCVGVLFVIWPQQWGGPVTWAIVAGTSMEPKYHTGDVVIAVKSLDGYNVGDVVVYQVHDGPSTGRVVHRIVRKLDNGNFLTQGDNKEFTDPWEVRPAWIQGEVQTMIPQGARFLLILRSPIFLAVIAGLLITGLLWPRRKDEVDVRDVDSSSDAGPDLENSADPVDIDAAAGSTTERGQ